MDAETFRQTAEQILNELPIRFRRLMENVVIVVEDVASEQVLASMGAAPDELLGLYEGCPITERDAVASGLLPDMIHLYRKPILAMRQQSGRSVEYCIRDVLIHEVGHHFGFSDAQMAVIESVAEQEVLS